MTLNNSLYLKDVWNKVIQTLRKYNVVEDKIIETYYEPSYIYELTENRCIVCVPSIVHKTVINQYKDHIYNSLENLFPEINNLTIDIYQENEVKKLMETRLEQKTVVEEPIETFEGSPINKQLTFDNFIVGDCNRESQAAALACAVNPGQFFNPLFIYGNSGLGKTHLLSAIGNYILDKDPSAKVFYIGTLKFVEMTVDAIKKGKIEALKKYMYSLDVLLIDDIQFLAGKDKNHEIFFGIFNELVNNHKQICITSDKLPQDIKGLEERLITRFSSGLSVGIDSPELETSIKMLKSKLSDPMYSDATFDEEVFAFIASNFNENVRSLEGALNRVIFYAIQFQRDGGRIKLETAMAALKDHSPSPGVKSKINARRIIKAVADFYGLTADQIISKTRTGQIANARHISIYLCRKLLDLPYIKIGDEFGGRDHSTIISSCTKVEKQLKTDQFFAKAVEDIEKSIHN